MGIFKSLFGSSIPKNRTIIKVNFPEADAAGNKALKVRTIKLSGYSHSNYGSDPQKVIKRLVPGEKLVLYAEPDNRFDSSAVSVFTSDNIFIGWIPSGSNKTISKKLLANETVYARFKEKDVCEVVDYESMKQDYGDEYVSPTDRLQYTNFYDVAIIEVQTFSSAKKKG